MILLWIEFNVFVTETGYEFDKEKLLEYNHMSFGGPTVEVETDEEANELLRDIQLESAIGKNE